MVFINILCCEAESVQPAAAKDELGDDEEEAEFGLVDAFVFLHHVFGAPVGEEAAEEEAEEGTDEGRSVHVATVCGGEVEGWGEEDCGEDDSD